MKEFVITDAEQGIRLDKQLLKILNLAGSGFIYKLLRKKNITLNGRRAEGNEHLASGDIIRIYLAEDTFNKFSSDRKMKDVMQDTGLIPDISKIMVYEDDKLLLVNKPVGILSQKAAASDVSINELCLRYLIDKKELTSEKLRIFKPSVCNRLDRNTSGIVIFAKTYSIAAAVNAALKYRTLHKYYLCIAEGRLNETVRYKGYLRKDRSANKVYISGEPAERAAAIETGIKPLKTADSYTLLEVELITGKSHQIRAQLAAIGHPLLGDVKYGGGIVNNNAQFLHAYKLVVPEDADTELKYLAGNTFTATPPVRMENMIRDIFGVDINAYMEQQGTAGLYT